LSLVRRSFSRRPGAMDLLGAVTAHVIPAALGLAAVGLLYLGRRRLCHFARVSPPSKSSLRIRSRRMPPSIRLPHPPVLQGPNDSTRLNGRGRVPHANASDRPRDGLIPNRDGRMLARKVPRASRSKEWEGP